MKIIVQLFTDGYKITEDSPKLWI